MNNVTATSLVAEFRSIGLDEARANRAAFTALAHSQGWGTARIGRFLGVSRARVGQRIERLNRYSETRGDEMPRLVSLLQPQPPSDSGTVIELPVGFPAANWEDEDFATGMLELVA